MTGPLSSPPPERTDRAATAGSGPDTPPTLDAALRLRRGPLNLEITLTTAAERIAVVAPSGAGKSTLIRIMAGLEPDAAGHLRVRGESWMEPGQSVPAWDRGVGWVPQDALLLPHLSVRANLLHGRLGQDADAVTRATAAMECDHLLDRRPRNLSGGERQRVALARGLLAARNLLLLDEPFSALDRRLRDRLVPEVDRWAAERKLPIVLVSHDARDPDALGCEQWELQEGRLERVSPPRAPR